MKISEGADHGGGGRRSLYYAYINDQIQVEADVEHPSWHMILAERESPFSLRQTLSGEGERRAFSPSMTVLSPCRIGICWGAVLFPTRQEKSSVPVLMENLTYAALG